MVQFVLIRPGTSEFDEQGRIQGNLDIPLSELGMREVQECVAELKSLGLTVLYSCPCEAAWQTASTIASGLGIKAKQVEALTNVDHGLWQGMQLEEVKRKQPRVFRQWQDNPETVCPPEGEMIATCRQRVQAAIAKLQKKHREGVVGIVVPEPLAGIVFRTLQHTNSTDTWKPNARGAAWQLLGGAESLPSMTASGANLSVVNGNCQIEASQDRRLPLASNGINGQNGAESGSFPAAISLELRS